MGCYVTVDFDAEKNIKEVSGNTSPKGDSCEERSDQPDKGRHPSIVRIDKGEIPVAP